MSPENPHPPFPPQGLVPPGIEAKMDPAPRFPAPEYRAAGKLTGKVALITGGDSGIGRAVALLFAREGADVAFTYLPEESADAEVVVHEIEAAGGRAQALVGDIRGEEFCKEVVRLCVQSFGRLDILVNNAAVQYHRDGIDAISGDQWDETFGVNVRGMFQMVKAALPYLEEGAAIINSGSVTGLEGSARLLDYSATKGAIHAFTKSLAQNLLRRGIRVNCVAPGPVWTPLNPVERPEEETREFGVSMPIGRPAQPEEIAPTYVFLASEADSSYMTGEVIAHLGGSTRVG